jgi:2Fe-2S ferredoxin
MFTIKIRFEEERREEVEVNNIRSGQSLLEVCLNKGIDLRHDCGGICSCSTCHIYVLAGNEYLEEAGRKEKDFINRIPVHNSQSRLACQCLIISKKGNIEIIIPQENTKYEI